MAGPKATARGQDAERARIVEALVDLVASLGYAQITVAMVLDRAEVGEQVFRRHFDDVEDCFCVVLKEMNDELVRRSILAFEAEDGWLNQIRALGYVIVEYLSEDPRRGRLLYVDILSLGERAQMIRDGAMEVFTSLVDRGRQELDDPDSVSRATAEGVTGAIYHRLHMIVLEGGVDSLSDMAPQMLYTAVLPYVGSAAALAELQRPQTSPPNGKGHGYPGQVPEESSGPGTETPGELGPLPAGRHGLTREQVAHNQRERLVAGLAHAVAEHGYNDDHDRPHHQGGVGLPSRLLRELRQQGGVLPRRLRHRHRPPADADGRGGRSAPRTGPMK